jgi:tetratricopeptide (TPR) repeat protein
MPAGSGPKTSALLLRSGALFIILYQLRLLAGGLADTPVFAAALVCAFAATWVLVKRQVSPVPAMVILILIPWAARTLIALPRIFVSGPAVPLDSLLLNLDRNNFVSLLPFYWTAGTTYFSLRSRRFLRADIIAADVLLLVIFCIVRTTDMEVYRWPVLMIALFTGLLFLQILALMLSLPPEYRLRKTEGLPGGLALFILVLLGGLLLIRPSQERAVDRGGGLLQPNLFRFDFSQFLRLESEISMGDDLVFIVRKDPGDAHIFLRRFVLSAYSPKQGFFRHESIDEKTHPQRLPGRRIRPEAEAIKAYRITNQEYFLVNFDASALIAMNEPVELIPFDSWDASSFSSAYGVQSHTSEALPFELIDSVQGPPGPEALGLSPQDYAFYTEYGGDERIAAFAREITQGLDLYWDQVQAVHDRLKYGEYRYSLKPGIAPDGDQLGYFLFDSRKGYCSYYAFAMTLLLRSLGIPARVAVGFFIDPELNTFDYYPVRSDMAHAWVEVRFPEYGWIEYDPTTTTLAEDEEFRFSSGVPQDLFERLMREILENRSRLSPKEGTEDGAAPSVLASLGRQTGKFLREHWGLLLAFLLGLCFIIIRSGPLAASRLNGNYRKKALLLWTHILRRLALGGFRRSAPEGEAEWAQALEDRIAGIYSLYQGTAAARYAPEYGREQWRDQLDRYGNFSVRYGKTVGPARRVLAWLFPPLALALPPSRRKGGAAALWIIILSLSLSLAADGAQAQTRTGEADALYTQALEAQNSELWERAIELYTLGARLAPLDSRFPWALGNLYYSRRLYGLAWDEYRRVETLDPYAPDILYRLARTAGYMNEDAVSAEYLERLLDIEPDNKEAIGSLGWMYYKLHRLGEGEGLLLAALERFGPDADYSMTLGTIYSDLFRYEEAKEYYLRAIAAGEDLGDRVFTAVAHYNLSILETRFYNFAAAFDRTNASLASQNRASGRLARGELFLRRLDISQALAEYQEAYETDSSPLSKVNLAQVYQIAGRLEEARLYAEDCLSAGDLSWMINYGIDPVRYKRDLHEILYNTYSGLEKTEDAMIYGTVGDAIRGFFRKISYRFKAAVHRRLFQKHSLLSADAYGADVFTLGEQRLDALIQYYNAFESYPRRALSYLDRARDFEVPRIPQAEFSYDAEEGALLKKTGPLRGALLGFDPLWERDMIAETYAELARLAGSRRTAEGLDAAERLYALNRGALRQRGIALPVELTIDAAALPETPSRIERTLRRVLARAGIDAAAGRAAAGPASRRFRFTITITGTGAGAEALCEFYDGGRGIRVLSRKIPLNSLSAGDISAFIRTLGDAVFVER